MSGRHFRRRVTTARRRALLLVMSHGRGSGVNVGACDSRTVCDVGVASSALSESCWQLRCVGLLKGADLVIGEVDVDCGGGIGEMV